MRPGPGQVLRCPRVAAVEEGDLRADPAGACRGELRRREVRRPLPHPGRGDLGPHRGRPEGPQVRVPAPIAWPLSEPGLPDAAVHLHAVDRDREAVPVPAEGTDLVEAPAVDEQRVAGVRAHGDVGVGVASTSESARPSKSASQSRRPPPQPRAAASRRASPRGGRAPSGARSALRGRSAPPRLPARPCRPRETRAPPGRRTGRRRTSPPRSAPAARACAPGTPGARPRRARRTRRRPRSTPGRGPSPGACRTPGPARTARRRSRASSSPAPPARSTPAASCFHGQSAPRGWHREDARPGGGVGDRSAAGNRSTRRPSPSTLGTGLSNEAMAPAKPLAAGSPAMNG